MYDPLGRSYMQEAVDEIVTLLTEEQYRGKMVVIFAGYAGQMTELLNKVRSRPQPAAPLSLHIARSLTPGTGPVAFLQVNPGLKSRVSDVIDFPDFSARAAAELAAQVRCYSKQSCFFSARANAASECATQMLSEKRLTLPDGLGVGALEPWTTRLVTAVCARGLTPNPCRHPCAWWSKLGLEAWLSVPGPCLLSILAASHVVLSP